jgi:hypothetical protein
MMVMWVSDGCFVWENNMGHGGRALYGISNVVITSADSKGTLHLGHRI